MRHGRLISTNALYKYKSISSLDTSQQNYCCDCELNHCNCQNLMFRHFQAA